MFSFFRSGKKLQAVADSRQVRAQWVNANALLQRLEWTVLRRLDGLLQGDYRTLMRGFGLDFADLREYQPQDDVRYIDWNVTARMNTPYVREFQEDREVEGWFVLDLSGSVNFGSVGVKKSELAAEFTGTMARLLTRRGNRVGAILKGQHTHQTPRVITPLRGRQQVLHLLDAIDSYAHLPEAEQGAGTTDLAQLIKFANNTVRRRSVVFVLSDFVSLPGWDEALSQLSRRHEVIAVRLFDPLEQQLPAMGFVVMQDAETGEQLLVDTQDRAFRARFAQITQERERNLRQTCRNSGVDFLELSTTDQLAQEILRFVDMRKRRARFHKAALA